MLINCLRTFRLSIAVCQNTHITLHTSSQICVRRNNKTHSEKYISEISSNLNKTQKGSLQKNRSENNTLYIGRLRNRSSYNFEWKNAVLPKRGSNLPKWKCIESILISELSTIYIYIQDHKTTAYLLTKLMFISEIIKRNNDFTKLI